MMFNIRFFLLLLTWLTAAPAAPLEPEQVPEPLKPWIDWVLQDYPEHGCPFLYHSYEQKRCAWPTQLALALNDRRGQFTITWKIYRESWISLPGSDKHWPLNVTVNERPGLVLEKNNRPVIKLAAGDYRIAGDFIWGQLPDSLTIPPDTGLIALNINGTEVRSPTLKQGEIWLKSTGHNDETENLQNTRALQVFRKITDDVPLRIETLLVLEVGGEARELTLAQPLLQGFVPLRITSPLPARLESDGRLTLQVRPGRWEIRIVSRSVQNQTEIPLKPDAKQWPPDEIWVFDAKPSLRVVAIENLPAIDPNQTNLPPSWKKFPAYRVRPGESLRIKVLRRGDAEAEPNQLQLTRTLWLDFDGDGYTVNDKIGGLLTRGRRLDAAPGVELGKISLDDVDQLVTRLPGSDRQGVEIRKGTVNLSADSRISGTIDAISAVGWRQSFRQVSAELNLPPGWRLLAAGGVDNVPDSWLSRWTLLDLFLVLIAALAVARLWNYYHGGLALVTLALIWHEPGAPQWVWLNILAATALLRVLPTGKFQHLVNWYRNAAWLGLIMIAVPFMVNQVRIGLYPQLELSWQHVRPVGGGIAQAPSVPAPEATLSSAMKKSRSKADSVATPLEHYVGSYPSQALNFERVDPNAHIQTGPGLPQWQWRKIRLSWNGSVDASQRLRLWYLPPVATMLLNFLSVLLLAGLALLLFGRTKLLNYTAALKSLAIWIVLPILIWPGHEAAAGFPDKALLEELKTRMLAAPDCLPACAEISRMRVSISERMLTLDLDIDAQKAVALPLPAAYRQWLPNKVSIDGKPAPALYRTDTLLWLGLKSGHHRVLMRGTPPRLSKFVLPLRLKPKRVDVENSGWLVTGVHENGLADAQLQFSKAQNTTPQTSEQRLEPTTLPPFVRIERILELGLDWHITTRVIRVSPRGSAIVLSYPLLPGESVTTAGVRVDEGNVNVNMTPEQTVMQWQSALKKTETIALTAADTDQWIEVWRAEISPVWHVETEGIAMMHLNRQGYWIPEWHPWPGEQLSFTVTRPEPVAGRTLTIESSRLSLKPGKRARTAELQLNLNSSQGQQHTLRLPEAAELEAVIIDGNSQPIRQQGRSVTLPVHPGKQSVRLSWKETIGLATVTRTSAIDLGTDSVNSYLDIELPQNRWVLLTLGPDFGPAVLIWGVLVVLILLAGALGKVPLTPLKGRHWFLLLIGLSQIPVAAAFVVVAWLMLLGTRKIRQPEAPVSFNALQLLLGVLTLTSLLLLFVAVEQGLLGTPEMQITGNHSTAYRLHWYQDRSTAALPQAQVISLPLTVYRLAMLAWSLWLATALLNWLKWGWDCFSTEGLWRKRTSKENA